MWVQINREQWSSIHIQISILLICYQDCSLVCWHYFIVLPIKNFIFTLFKIKRPDKYRTCSFNSYHKGAILYQDRCISKGSLVWQFIHKLNNFSLYLVRHHSIRPPGRLWAVQLARQLLCCLPVQHDVCWSHFCLPDQDRHLGSPERAHPCLWWVLPSFSASQYFLISVSYSTGFNLSCCVISFPTFGPTSRWAGLSSSDKKYNPYRKVWKDRRRSRLPRGPSGTPP